MNMLLLAGFLWVIASTLFTLFFFNNDNGRDSTFGIPNGWQKFIIFALYTVALLLAGYAH